MEEKDRDLKRARTVRSDYVRDVDAVTAWIQRAELRVQDRSAEPQVLRDHLQQVQAEIGPTEDRLERLSRNARTIAENTQDEAEKARVQATVRTLTDQLQQVRTWLHDKKQQVGDSLDAWARFMSLHQAVLAWVEEQTKFLSTPLQLSSLTQARQRLHDYTTALRSSKQAGKNLSDMSRELEQIGQVTAVGDLPEKLQAAEEAKMKVEALLLERNALLQETSEEWERCERKMKDVRSWMEKNQQSLDSPQNRKRPLRDQHANREKMLADASTQKTKIALSVEKLQIHFRSGVGGNGKVTEEASQLINELDRLMNDIKEQTTTLEACLSQIDQYQHEIQQLRTQIVSVEAQLRSALSPNYSPHDRDRALHDQNDMRSRVDILMDHILRIDPFWSEVSSGDAAARHFALVEPEISYADIAAGRISPCPVEAPESKMQKLSSDVFKTMNENESEASRKAVQQKGMDASPTFGAVPNILVADPDTRFEARDVASRSSTPVPQIITAVDFRRKASDSPKSDKRLRSPKESPRSPSPLPKATRKEDGRSRSRLPQEMEGVKGLALPGTARVRSPSPFFIPGETASFAQVLRSQSNQDQQLNDAALNQAEGAFMTKLGFDEARYGADAASKENFDSQEISIPHASALVTPASEKPEKVMPLEVFKDKIHIQGYACSSAPISDPVARKPESSAVPALLSGDTPEFFPRSAQLPSAFFDLHHTNINEAIVEPLHLSSLQATQDGSCDKRFGPADALDFKTDNEPTPSPFSYASILSQGLQFVPSQQNSADVAEGEVRTQHASPVSANVGLPRQKLQENEQSQKWQMPKKKSKQEKIISHPTIPGLVLPVDEPSQKKKKKSLKSSNAVDTRKEISCATSKPKTMIDEGKGEAEVKPEKTIKQTKQKVTSRKAVNCKEEDEIEKALKEIEALEKNKKKQDRGAGPFSKANKIAVVTEAPRVMEPKCTTETKSKAPVSKENVVPNPPQEKKKKKKQKGIDDKGVPKNDTEENLVPANIISTAVCGDEIQENKSKLTSKKGAKREVDRKPDNETPIKEQDGEERKQIALATLKTAGDTTSQQIKASPEQPAKKPKKKKSATVSCLESHPKDVLEESNCIKTTQMGVLVESTQSSGADKALVAKKQGEELKEKRSGNTNTENSDLKCDITENMHLSQKSKKKKTTANVVPPRQLEYTAQEDDHRNKITASEEPQVPERNATIVGNVLTAEESLKGAEDSVKAKVGKSSLELSQGPLKQTKKKNAFKSETAATQDNDLRRETDNSEKAPETKQACESKTEIKTAQDSLAVKEVRDEKQVTSEDTKTVTLPPTNAQHIKKSKKQKETSIALPKENVAPQAVDLNTYTGEKLPKKVDSNLFTVDEGLAKHEASHVTKDCPEEIVVVESIQKNNLNQSKKNKKKTSKVVSTQVKKNRQETDIDQKALKRGPIDNAILETADVKEKPLATDSVKESKNVSCAEGKTVSDSDSVSLPKIHDTGSAKSKKKKSASPTTSAIQSKTTLHEEKSEIAAQPAGTKTMTTNDQIGGSDLKTDQIEKKSEKKKQMRSNTVVEVIECATSEQPSSDICLRGNISQIDATAATKQDTFEPEPVRPACKSISEGNQKLLKTRLQSVDTDVQPVASSNQSLSSEKIAELQEKLAESEKGSASELLKPDSDTKSDVRKSGKTQALQKSSKSSKGSKASKCPGKEALPSLLPAEQEKDEDKILPKTPTVSVKSKEIPDGSNISVASGTNNELDPSDEGPVLVVKASLEPLGKSHSSARQSIQNAVKQLSEAMEDLVDHSEPAAGSKERKEEKEMRALFESIKAAELANSVGGSLPFPTPVSIPSGDTPKPFLMKLDTTSDDWLTALDEPITLDDDDNNPVVVSDLTTERVIKTEKTNATGTGPETQPKTDLFTIKLDTTSDDWLAALDEPIVLDDEDDDTVTACLSKKEPETMEEKVATKEVSAASNVQDSSKPFVMKLDATSDDWLVALDEPITLDDEVEGETQLAKPEFDQRNAGSGTCAGKLTEKGAPKTPFAIKLDSNSDDWLCALDEPITLDDDEDASPVSESLKEKKDAPVGSPKDLTASKPFVIKLESSSDEWLHALDEPIILDDEDDLNPAQVSPKTPPLPVHHTKSKPSSKSSDACGIIAPCPTKLEPKSTTPTNLPVEPQRRSPSPMQRRDTKKSKKLTAETTHTAGQAGIFGSVKTRSKNPRKIIDQNPLTGEVRPLAAVPAALEKKDSTDAKSTSPESAEPRRSTPHHKEEKSQHVAENESSALNLEKHQDSLDSKKKIKQFDLDFWHDKWACHDAERNWQIRLAKRIQSKDMTDKDVPPNDDPDTDGNTNKSAEEADSSQKGELGAKPVGAAGKSENSDPTPQPVQTKNASLQETFRGLQLESQSPFANTSSGALPSPSSSVNLKDKIVRDTAVLAAAVAQSEKELEALPAHSLTAMHEELERILSELMVKDAVAARVQDNLDCLPQDEETLALSHGLSEVRAHLAELVTHLLQGRAAIQNAEHRGMSREQSVVQYQSLLAELESWLSSAGQLVSANVQDIPVAELQNQLSAHKRLGTELRHHETRLLQLSGICAAMQRQPDTQHLAPSLLSQLTSLQDAFQELSDVVPARIAALQVPGMHPGICLASA